MNEQEKFNLFFQITKIDVPKRQIWGRATQEVKDAVREVMDYDSSVPNFQKWSQAAKSRTSHLPESEQSLGNVREMHSPIAAGKVIDITFNNMEKAVDIGTYCADDSSWDKALKGVLTGFSVGGKYAKRWPDPRNPTLMRYTADPEEVSYVDSPAVPTATFSLIKSDGSMELRKVGDPVSEIPTPAADNPDNTRRNNEPGQQGWNNPDPENLTSVRTGQLDKDIPKAAGFVSPDLIQPGHTAVENPGADPRSDPIAKGLAAIQQFNAIASEIIAMKKAGDEEKNKAEAGLKAVGERVGIARRASEPLTPPAGYPLNPHDYGDPANWSWTYDKRDSAQVAVNHFNAGLGKSNYSEREWNVLGRRIEQRATKLFGAKYRYDPQLKKVTPMDPKDLQKVDAGALLAQLKQGLDVIVDQVGSDPDALRDLLMNTLGNLDSASGSPSSASVSGSSPSDAPTGSQAGLKNVALKAASPPSTPSGTPMTTGTGTDPNKATMPPGTGTPTAAPTATPSSPDTAKTAATPAGTTPIPSASTPSSSSSSSSSSSDSSDPSNIFKALEETNRNVASLSETVKQLAALMTGAPSGATVAPVQKALPVGDLAAMLTNPEPTTDPILAILDEGGPGSYLKAAQLAGTPERPDFTKVNQLMDKALNERLTPGFTRMMVQRGYVHFDPAGLTL